MQKNLILFAGCSYTAGHGWGGQPTDAGKQHSKLWCNLVSNQLGLSALNVGQGGGSNRDIFRNSVDAIATYCDQINFVIVQWTSMPRYRFHLGLEDWPTEETLQIRDRNHDVGLTSGTISRKEINKIIDRFLSIHHLHPEICDLVMMCNSLIKLCNRLNLPLYFVNGLCPWDLNYFEPISNHNRTPDQLTKFTQETILDIKNRSDHDVFRQYDRIHDNYKLLGTIQPNYWINLYSSFRNLQQDTNYDNQHPGTLSNQNYANIVLKHIST